MKKNLSFYPEEFRSSQAWMLHTSENAFNYLTKINLTRFAFFAYIDKSEVGLDCLEQCFVSLAKVTNKSSFFSMSMFPLTCIWQLSFTSTKDPKPLHGPYSTRHATCECVCIASIHVVFSFLCSVQALLIYSTRDSRREYQSRHTSIWYNS